VIVAKMGIEAMVLHTGVRLLSRIGQDARRRVLAYWNACAASLPLTDGNGKVLVENPVETDPPILTFTNSHREPATTNAEAEQ
jgi:hypothetical protein